MRRPRARRGPWRVVVLAALWVAGAAFAHPGAHATHPAEESRLPARPAPGDDSAASLQEYHARLLEALGGDPRAIPLERKSEHFEWLLWRYHLAPHRQVMPRVRLPEKLGEAVTYEYGADISTWNGALLAALSYRYAVMRDPETRKRIVTLLEGLRFFQEITGKAGLAARCVLESDEPVRKATKPWVAPDGRRFVYRDDSAKGTYNQIVHGYAAFMMHVLPDLPDDARRRARADLAALALHLIDHDYRITGLDGEPTPYGGLRPFLFWRTGMPFNAQVAYGIVAASHHFAPDHPGQRERIAAEFRRLRKRHPFHQMPWRPPFYAPQRVGKSRFIDANDVNHLTNAAFMGIALELHAARSEGRPADRDFLYRLGRTLYWSVPFLSRHRNGLANLMWVALLNDPEASEALVPKKRERAMAQAEQLLDVAIEQLRRFPLDRLRWEGEQHEGDGPHWVDEYRPDSYYWKVEPHLSYQVTGGPTNQLFSAIDYLHAYWLMRHYRLDESRPAQRRHAGVL